MLKKLSIILLTSCFVLLTMFSFTSKSLAATEIKSRYNLIDGKQTISPELDKSVKLEVRTGKKDKNNREIVWGFSSRDKFINYSNLEKSVINVNDIVAQGSGPSYTDFYWEINKGGGYFSIAPGYVCSLSGNGWNDQISSISTAKYGSYTVLWQNTPEQNYGYGIAFSHSQYYGSTINLTDYYMGDGTNWNDQTSYIEVKN
ncbi:hypothetical protein FOA24_31820 [Bacillus thuringiensis]|uniref:hypothetical protein n=1 Tax=Bacillus thuringiensis TaxID=1428 RepID=UPI00333AC811